MDRYWLKLGTLLLVLFVGIVTLFVLGNRAQDAPSPFIEQMELPDPVDPEAYLKKRLHDEGGIIPLDPHTIEGRQAIRAWYKLNQQAQEKFLETWEIADGNQHHAIH